MRAVIFAGGKICDYSYIKSLLKPDDMIIAADSGLDHLEVLDITPDVFVGDMDSVKGTVRGAEVVKLQVMKDETDTEAGVNLAIDKGAEEVLILGAIGTRMDHTLANLLLIKKLSALGVKASVIDEHNEIYYLNAEINLSGNNGDIVSIVPLADLKGVTTSGLLYKLSGGILKAGTSCGVSNVMTDSVCRISVKSGEALVIKSRD